MKGVNSVTLIITHDTQYYLKEFYSIKTGFWMKYLSGCQNAHITLLWEKTNMAFLFRLLLQYMEKPNH